LWFSLHGIILEEKPIGPDPKKSLKESSWFGEPKCKLGSKVVHSIVFFFFSFFIIFLTLVAQIMWEWKTFYELRTLLRAHQFPHFWPILKLTWLVLWILTRWFFQCRPIFMHCNATPLLQCCLISIHCNATTFAITQCMAIIKTKATNILCIRSSIVCSKNKKGEKR
jgi:hypothetical protein